MHSDSCTFGVMLFIVRNIQISWSEGSDEFIFIPYQNRCLRIKNLARNLRKISVEVFMRRYDWFNLPSKN